MTKTEHDVWERAMVAAAAAVAGECGGVLRCGDEPRRRRAAEQAAAAGALVADAIVAELRKRSNGEPVESASEPVAGFGRRRKSG